ncbi:MAG: alpha/beta hydrolase [Microbacteriaceae bacterium]|nr:alpha/beta hydrolase [Microbacteriaceae bacterium]
MLTFRRSGDHSNQTILWIPSLGQRSDMWEKLASSLGDWSSVFVELPGHGDNPPATGPFTLRELADECRDFLTDTTHEGDRVVVVGLSIGGAIALEVAHSMSADVVTVVMGAGATMGDAAVWRSRAEAARSSGTEGMKEAARLRWFTDEFASGNPLETNTALDNLGRVDGESYALCAEALGDFDGTHAAQNIAGPVLVIGASEDEVVPIERARALSNLIPRGEFREIPNARHLFPIEKPKDVAALIDGFLDRNQVKSSR